MVQINLAPPGKEPVCVEAGAVTMVTEQDGKTGVFVAGQESFISLEGENYLPASECAAHLAAAGANLVYFPARWPDRETGADKIISENYLNPRNFEFMNSYRRENGGFTNIRLGGYGLYYLIESSSLTADEWEALRSAFAQGNISFREIPFESDGRILLFNPAKIKELSADMVSIKIKYGAGEHKKQSINFFPLPPRLAAQKWFETDPELDNLADQDLQAAWDKALEMGQASYEQEKAAMPERLENMAESIAAAAPQLQKVENARFPFFVKTDEVDQVLLTAEDDPPALHLLYKESFGRGHFDGRDAAHVFFTGPAAAKLAYEKLRAAGALPYAPPAPEGPAP